MIRIILIVCLIFQIGFQATGQGKKIFVEVNKNIELISTLNNQIATSFLKDSADSPYLYKTTRLMRLNYEHFKPFGQHPAVAGTMKMSKRIGTGVYLLGLYFDELPKLVQKQPVSEIILQEIHPDKDSANMILKDYIGLIRQFYYDTNFEQYFLRNKPLYELAVREVKQNLPEDRFITALEAYYGMQKSSYHINVMPSFKSGWGMGWQLENKGKTDVFNIAAPLQEQILNKDKRVLTAGYNNPEEIRNLSVHEFGHSFINPLTTQAHVAKQLDNYKHLFKPIPNQGQYSDWLNVFNEHLVRAGEIRIALQLGQEEESKRLQEQYKDWMYLPHFIAQLKTYERNRVKYRSLENYLPIIIASLAEL
jgi:hypothetical protein